MASGGMFQFGKPEAHVEQVATPARSAAKDAPASSTYLRAAVKKYDVVGDPRGAAAELKSDLVALREQLPAIDFREEGNSDEVLRECQALRKWMRAIGEDADTSAERAEVEGIEATIKDFCQKLRINPDVQPFPFAKKMYKELGFEALVRCVDKLRELYGKDLDNMDIHLPILVAVGKESAGKSSVMEMIAGQPFFPRDEGICTRLPFRLQFRRSPEHQQPFVCFQDFEDGRCERPDQVQKRIADITRERTKNEDISTEEVVLIIEKGDVPELTLVDLPGLIGSSYASEKQGLKEKVHKLVKSYIEQPHAIILAVASADSRLRDSEIFSMVKDAGAEDRAIGLLTKCDLATDKRHKLSEKLDGTLEGMEAREQERNGYIPLKRGYYGMICRDTMREDRQNEHAQDQDAIDSAQRREQETFDELHLGEKARARCGVKNVYEALTGIFRDYIQNNWQPDVMKQLDQGTSALRLQQKKLHFSIRYAGNPPGPDDLDDKGKAVTYKQELDVRAEEFTKLMKKLLLSYELSDKLNDKLAELDGIKLSTRGDPTRLALYFADQFKTLQEGIEQALRAAKEQVMELTKRILDGSSAANLPKFSKFALSFVDGRVQGYLDKAIAQVASVVELEASAPLVSRSEATTRIALPRAVDVHVGVLLSGERMCAICHEPLCDSLEQDLLRCCSKMFHAACLDKVPNPKPTFGGQGRQSCPLCRAPFGPAERSTHDEAAAQAAVQELESRRKVVVSQARKAAAGMIYKLRADLADGGFDLSSFRKDFGAKALAETQSGHHLLEEKDGVRQERAEIERKLSILQTVRDDIEAWSDL